jgi:hypothetical protein
MKYPVLRDLKFNGRFYPAGSAIGRDAIFEVSEAKLGTLLRTRYIGDPGDKPLEDMSNAELRDHARDMGVTGPLPRSNQGLIEVIEGAKHGN